MFCGALSENFYRALEFFDDRFGLLVTMFQQKFMGRHTALCTVCRGISGAGAPLKSCVRFLDDPTFILPDLSDGRNMPCKRTQAEKHN